MMVQWHTLFIMVQCAIPINRAEVVLFTLFFMNAAFMLPYCRCTNPHGSPCEQKSAAGQAVAPSGSLFAYDAVVTQAQDAKLWS